MGYETALEATGVSVKTFKEFGSYQGTWIAILEDGRFVEGSYGSCSGCDAYQAEFDYNEIIEQQQDGKFYKENSYWNEEDEITKEEADLLNAGYQEKLKSFGQSYVNGAESREEIISRYEKKCADEYAWEDDKEILEWIRAN